MTIDFRPAAYILLTEPYVTLFTQAGSSYGWQEWERQRWQIDGEPLTKWIKALGLDFSRYVSEPRYKDGKQSGTREADLMDEYPLQLERLPVRHSLNRLDDYRIEQLITKLEARVISANLLDIRITFCDDDNDEETFEITHSGGFNVWWS